MTKKIISEMEIADRRTVPILRPVKTLAIKSSLISLIKKELVKMKIEEMIGGRRRKKLLTSWSAETGRP